MGDVIHALPVLADVAGSNPSWQVDWMVEESFAGIPQMHPRVCNVIPVAVRRWRKAWWKGSVQAEWRAFKHRLASSHYDLVLDLQGLLKSAWLASKANGPVAGYDSHSIREPIASYFYDRRFAVSRTSHAVTRNRQLAAEALGYTIPSSLDYGLAPSPVAFSWLPHKPYAVLLHATSRADKQWSVAAWQSLAVRLHELGLACVLPWGSQAEQQAAATLARGMPNAVVAPQMSLADAAGVLAGARLTVGVDTGLSHLAAAVACPTIALFCASEPGLTGVMADSLCWNLGHNGMPPSVDDVWRHVMQVLAP